MKTPKFTPSVVLVNQADGLVRIEEVPYCAGGLAITPVRLESDRGRVRFWTITHTGTGKAVSYRCNKVSVEKKLLNLLLNLPISWTGSEEAVLSQEKKLPEELRQLRRDICCFDAQFDSIDSFYRNGLTALKKS